jgi:hypothetical protein
MGNNISVHVHERRLTAAQAWDRGWCEHVALTREVTQLLLFDSQASRAALPNAVAHLHGNQTRLGDAFDAVVLGRRGALPSDDAEITRLFSAGRMKTLLYEHIDAAYEVVKIYKEAIVSQLAPDVTPATLVDTLLQAPGPAEASLSRLLANGDDIARTLYDAYRIVQGSVEADLLDKLRGAVKRHLVLTLTYAAAAANARELWDPQGGPHSHPPKASPEAWWEASLDHYRQALEQAQTQIAPAFAALNYAQIDNEEL